MSSTAAPDLPRLLTEVGRWQHDDLPVQLHPGDVGWATRLGADATAAALRTWWRGERLVVLGLLDGPDVLRLAVAPDVADDAGLAVELADDLGSGSLAAVRDVEARVAPAIAAELAGRGWGDGDSWTSLALDLADPPEPVPAGVTVERVTAATSAAWSDVLASSFGVRHADAEAQRRWDLLVDGPAADGLHPLLLRDGAGEVVAVAGAWSAGPGRPGLVEPLGVHADHRGRGLGVAVTRAAAAVLRDHASSSVTVATPTANTGAVATYRSAGCREVAVTRDLRRPA